MVRAPPLESTPAQFELPPLTPISTKCIMFQRARHIFSCTSPRVSCVNLKFITIPSFVELFAFLLDHCCCVENKSGGFWQASRNESAKLYEKILMMKFR